MPHSAAAVSPTQIRVGTGKFTYSVDADWAHRPEGYAWPEVAAVATDSRDNVYVFNRGEHPVMIFDREGRFQNSWGEGQFSRAHGITIGPDDGVYCTDDFDHSVRKFTADGRLLLTLGTRGQPSDTGATSVDFRTIRRTGLPFHFPTNVAISAAGEIYVSDGYGNARIHRFSPEGKLIHSWGEPGNGNGQFHIPHGIAINEKQEVFVADRENSRVQIFGPTGKYLDQWTDVARPCQIQFDRTGNMYVAELGYRAGMWPGTSAPSPDATGGRVSVFDSTGNLQARWGGGDRPTDPGDFFAPHDVCIDSQGDMYVAEVMWSAGGNRGLVAPDCHSLQKFSRLK